jgi:hypothetical protein
MVLENGMSRTPTCKQSEWVTRIKKGKGSRGAHEIIEECPQTGAGGAATGRS